MTLRWIKIIIESKQWNTDRQAENRLPAFNSSLAIIYLDRKKKDKEESG